jgi:predicted nucleic acid-binding protein
LKLQVALDSNVLIYAEGLTHDPRSRQAQSIIAAVPFGQLILPVQAIAETLRWLIVRPLQPKAVAARSVQAWLTVCTLQATDLNVMISAC